MAYQNQNQGPNTNWVNQGQNGPQQWPQNQQQWPQQQQQWPQYGNEMGKGGKGKGNGGEGSMKKRGVVDFFQLGASMDVGSYYSTDGRVAQANGEVYTMVRNCRLPSWVLDISSNPLDMSGELTYALYIFIYELGFILPGKIFSFRIVS